MKKLAVIILCIVLLASAFACKNKTDQSDTVVPETTYATVQFVVAADYYVVETPEPITVAVGTVPTLPSFEGGAMDEHDALCWFTEVDLTNEGATLPEDALLLPAYDNKVLSPYDTSKPILGDLTLYLYEVGKVYSITYQGLEGFDPQGEYVFSYRYNNTVNDHDAPVLPTVNKPGYVSGLYCVELDAHYIKVPTNAGCDLTFTAPKPIEYGINYAFGEVGDATVTNPNPTTYTAVGETLTLLPASCEGKTFDCWVVKVWSTPKTFVVDGEEIHLTAEGTRVTKLSYEMIQWGYQNFTVVAKWI